MSQNFPLIALLYMVIEATKCWLLDKGQYGRQILLKIGVRIR